MSEYQHYVNYHNANDRIRERLERSQKLGFPARRRRHAGRTALARGLHSIAERLEG